MPSSSRAASEDGNFVIKAKVRHLLRKPENRDETLACASWLYNRFRVPAVADTIENYLVIAQLIRGLSDSETQTKAAHLRNALAWHFAGSIPATKKELGALQLMAVHLQRKITELPSSSPLAAVEQLTLYDFSRLLSAHTAIVATVEMVKEQFAPGHHPRPHDAPEDKAAQADGVARRLEELREYPVPQCIMQDGIIHDAELCWVFYDGPATLHKMPGEFLAGLRTPLAYTLLVEKADIQTTLEPNAISEGDSQHAIEFGFPYLAMVVVQTDGSMSVDAEYGIYSLKRAFKAAGYEEDYELFRLIHLLRLADLVIPETVRRQRKIRAWPDVATSTKSRRREEIETLFRTFLVPRQRVLFEPGLGDNIRRQVQAGRQLTDENSSVRRQGGYLWPLSPGKNATPRARELYRLEWGREIPEGHTYTSAHDHRYRDPQRVREARRRSRQNEE